MKKILTYCLLLCSIPLVAQPDSATLQLSSFIQNINTFNQLYPQEKVYLHFDNTGYFLGETIWFKAYVVVAENLQPTVLSRVLYVELLSPEGNIVETKKLKIEDGQCHGDFYLKPEQFAGFYEVRAYTKLMLNWEDTYFSRVFPIFDAPKEEGQYDKLTMNIRPNSRKLPEKRNKDEKRNVLNITFLPEGGHLVNGTTSRVACVATDKTGQHVSVSGTLLNEHQETITTFATIHNGMGSFIVTPDGKKQTIKVEYEGKTYSFYLPDALPAGYVMKIDNLRKDFVIVEIQESEIQTPEPLGVSISCRGKVHVFETIETNESANRILKISKKDLPSGVNQITLFNAQGEIFAERLFFINHNEQIAITANPDKSAYQPFEKINIDLQLSAPVETSFSLSVTDAATSPFSSNGSPLTNLLLASDLKGHIENIDYYFESDDNQHKMALDLLMMTQGWRRYSWKQMAGIEPFELKHHIEKGIVIDGQVLSLYRKKQKENIEVSMWMYSEEGFSQQGKCITDEEGRFNFLPDDFYGTWELLLQTKENEKRKENRIVLDRHFSPQTKEYSYYDINLLRKQPIQETGVSTDLSNNIDIDKEDINIEQTNPKSYLLPDVTIKGKKWTKREEEGLKIANVIYDVSSETDKIKDLGENYTENIPTFLLNTNNFFSVSNGYKYKNKPVLFIINNMEICRSSWEDISNVLVQDIETIMISEKIGAYCSYMPFDLSCTICEDVDPRTLLIFLYTYENGNKHDDPKGIRKTKIVGYDQSKEFFVADYSSVVLPDEKDFRRTLYWNPNVKTDNTGKANVSFYNNSSCKQINISAEGITLILS